MILMLETALKVTAVLAAALGALALLRTESAALRHWVLTVAIGCAAAMPLLVAVLPAWRAVEAPSIVATLTPAADVVAVADANILAADATRPASPSGVARAIAAVWIAGTLICVLLLAIGLARLRWIASRSRELHDGPWRACADEIARKYGVRRIVTVLQSDHAALLVTWGFARPKIVLPAAAATWSDARARIVLCHELAHIRRGDWASQILAELLRCVFWFNPLAWIACRRLRLESEQACDDAVLGNGVEGTAYATELVELARILNTHRQSWFPAPAMARPSSLERRISAMLNDRLNRRPMTRIARAITVVSLTALTLPMAALAQQAFSTLSGSVFDPSDALLPATKVVLTNVQTKAKYEVAADRTGRFEFVGLPAGEYSLQTDLPGFATAHATLTVSGQDLQKDVRMQVASLEESITVTDGPSRGTRDVQIATRRPLPACSSAPVAGGIGGNIRPPMRLKNVDPVYPANVPGARAVELVRLNARLNTDGTIKSIEPVNPETDPAFVNAALDAVRQWEFDETLLNCVPIEVSLTVTVRFRAAANEQAHIRYNLTLPNGAKPQLTSADGAVGTLSIPDVGEFAFLVKIENKSEGLVRFSLIEGLKRDGPVIGETTVRMGEPPAKIGTKPEFTIALVAIQ